MRQEMSQRLTPRMIQSMEILQLPLQALEERIEQELQSNPVLEMREPGDDPDAPAVDVDSSSDGESEDEQTLIVNETDQARDFNRLERISEYLENEEFSPLNDLPARGASVRLDGERDRKLDAMANTAARGEALTEHLLKQWSLVEALPSIKAAGRILIGQINDDGYLLAPLEDLLQDARGRVTLEDLQAALPLVRKLDPPGVGARTLSECLLLQLDDLAEQDEADGHDLDLERRLITDHAEDLKLNRYPRISKKLGRPVEELKAAVKRLARLHPHPGRQIGPSDAPPITPDALIRLDEQTGKYEIEMARDPASDIYIRGKYRRMLKDRAVDKSTREFLANNVRNARWLIESIAQRAGTIQRVIRVVVDAQREFFEKGPEFLRPLPMIQVADQLGIHVATVSRAVHDKWIQTPRGVYPLRRFFSGGTTSADGEDMSWDAVKEKLKAIVDNEDKQNPLNDDQIMERIQQQGITLARRTVAKYRKILDIPTARQRREF